MGLEVEWVDDARRWREYREDWDDLVERSERPSIFSTWDFLEVCWLRFAQPHADRLAILTLHDNGRVIGFAPLRHSVRRRFGLPLRRLSVLGAWESDPDRVPLILPPEREAECTEALLGSLERRGRDWDYLELGGMSPDSELVLTSRRWARAHHNVRLVEQATSPSPYVRLEGTGQDVLARLGPATRQSIRRHRRRLEALGPVELEVLESPDEIEQGLDLYLELEQRSWKKDAAEGAGKHERNRAFYRELLPRLSRKGRVTISFLNQGHRRLAGKIDFRLGASVWGSHWAYDKEYARFSPGNLLLALCLQWHAERGVREYELFARFLENKLRWTKTVRHNVRLRLLRLDGLRRRVLFMPGLLRRLRS